MRTDSFLNYILSEIPSVVNKLVGNSKNKLRIFALNASYHYLSVVKLNDRAYYIESHPYSGSVKSPGFIRFIESVENQRQLLFAKSLTGACYRDNHHISYGLKVKFYISSVIYKLSGVFYDIIHNLINQVAVSVKHFPLNIHTGDLDMLRYKLVLR